MSLDLKNISINIENTDNAAFGETQEELIIEVRRILQNISSNLDNMLEDNFHIIRDINGNNVGYIIVEKEFNYEA